MPHPIYTRVLLKISGEELAGDGVLSAERLRSLAADVAQAAGFGVRLGIVVGGGNIYRGRDVDPTLLTQATGDQMGMLATVINGLALGDAIRAQGVRAHVFSVLPAGTATRPLVEREVLEVLDRGEICIFVAGTGNSYVTTDTTAVLRALQMQAEILLKATKVDGVYDADPTNNPSAKRFDQLTHQQALEQRLAVLDLAAFGLAIQYDLPIGVYRHAPGALQRIVTGELSVGTLVKKT
jgi:uridylate kinase